MTRKFVVCGVRLKPFSMGHLILLQRAGSPFIGGDYIAATPFDLVFALRACSMPATEAMATVDQALGLRWRWLQWRVTLCQRRARMRFLSRLVMFEEYIAEHYERAKTGVDSEESEPSGLVFMLLHLRTLREFYGLSAADRLNMPLAQVVGEYAAWLNSKKAARYLTMDEQEIIDGNRKTASGPLAQPVEIPDQISQ